MSRSGTRRSTILKRRSGGAERVILFIKRFGIGIAITVAVFWIGSWLAMSGVFKQLENRVEGRVLTITGNWGFRVQNILVYGRHYTDVDTLKAMVNIEKGDPIFAFHPAEARAMIEKLSWVKKAHIERRLPDTIYIRLEERKPIALWQRQQRLAVIDAEGVVLSDRNLGEFKDLLIVIGDQAPFRAASLIAMLKAEPEIEKRVEAAILVSGRRWDLKLKNGAEVRLPEDEIGVALRRLAINHEEEAILDKDVLTIDVREADRITVRTKPGAVQDFKAGSTSKNSASGHPI